MNRLRSRRQSNLDDLIRTQIAFFGWRRANQNRFITHRHVFGISIRFQQYTATVLIPIRRAVAATRQTISPRLAMRILLNMIFIFLLKI